MLAVSTRGRARARPARASAGAREGDLRPPHDPQRDRRDRPRGRRARLHGGRAPGLRPRGAGDERQRQRRRGRARGRRAARLAPARRRRRAARRLLGRRGARPGRLRPLRAPPLRGGAPPDPRLREPRHGRLPGREGGRLHRPRGGGPGDRGRPAQGPPARRARGVAGRRLRPCVVLGRRHPGRRDLHRVGPVLPPGLRPSRERRRVAGRRRTPGPRPMRSWRWPRGSAGERQRRLGGEVERPAGARFPSSRAPPANRAGAKRRSPTFRVRFVCAAGRSGALPARVGSLTTPPSRS